MPMTKADREFRLSKISYLDFKHVEMDRVLTALFARLQHNGRPSRLARSIELKTEAVVDELVERSEQFIGFGRHRDVVTRWVETHLMDVVNRGKSTQAIAAPRPLHGFTYRFRNPRHSRDYGTAQQIYEMLYNARSGAGQNAITALQNFFFRGYDRVTNRIDSSVPIDVETQALLVLLNQRSDAPDTSRMDRHPPLCRGAADLLADDVLRLLFYRRFIPSSVMVEYLKVLFAFHLALYHLRLLKLLPTLVARHGRGDTCAKCQRGADDPLGDCEFQVGLVIDVAGEPGTAMARLAERSADFHYRRIPGFIKAYFTARKLDEFGTELARRGKLSMPPGGLPLSQVLGLLAPAYAEERERFFGRRLYGLLETAGGSDEGAVDEEMSAISELGLSEFDTYIEMILSARSRFHRKYLTECLDSLLLKNRPGALVTQPRVRNGVRRFVLDSRLLEVLLQIAVLRPGGALGYHTGELRVDELLGVLRTRYGLYIDRLPAGDGFGEASIGDHAALRENAAAFTSRLREIGFYRDLSDAYVTQTVAPRYRIDAQGRARGSDTLAGDTDGGGM
jgi:hypothetical protein